MSKNRKLIIFFVVSVAVPLLAASINGYLAEKNVSWSENNLNIFSLYMLVISILGCLFVATMNNKLGNNKSIWYSLPITIAIALSLFLYFGYSVSNFGF